jgi:uncharacterized protein
MRTVEFRTLAGLTIEERSAVATSEGSEMVLTGYAAKFNALSKNLGGFYEKIAPGAFSRSLAAGDDCKCLFNHDKNLILGRRDSGTLSVEQDNTGLKFRCELNPKSGQHRDIYEAVRRRDITECSFAFTINGDAGEDWQPIAEKDEAGNQVVAIRTLKDLNLVDVSAVTYPAYNNTDVAARNITPEIRSALDSISKEIPKMANEGLKPEQRMDAGDSYEEQICEINSALYTAFPAKLENGDPTGWCKYWLVETYPAYIIVCEANYTSESQYFKITYTEGPEDTFTFGEPVAVEQGWVASERAIKFVTEQRSLQSKANDHKDAAAQHAYMADAHAKESKEHTEAAAAIEAKSEEQKAYRIANGLMDDEDYEDNCMVSRSDVWEDDPADDIAGDDDAEDIRSAKEVRRLERRGAVGLSVEERAAKTVRTKKVGGKALTSDKFAFVGDSEKTETWKLPIHDAAHVQNALARFTQTEGIPADKKAGVVRKIKAAAKKFGVDAASLDERAFPMGHDEIVDALNRASASLLIGQV